MNSEEGASRAVKLVGYGVIALLFFFVVEISAYVITTYLRTEAIVFDPESITLEYAAYLERRDELLGWDYRLVDDYGGRPDSDAKPDWTPCVEMYGDSFTYSSEVSGNETWPAALSRILDCRVVNFGVPGFGSDQAFMKYDGKDRLAPIVFLNHWSENIIRNVNQFRNLIYPNAGYALKPRYVVREGALTHIALPTIPHQGVADFLKEPGLYLKNETFLPDGEAGVLANPSFPYSLVVLKALGHWRVEAKLQGKLSHQAFYEPGHHSYGLGVTKKIFEAFEKRAFEKNQIAISSIIPACRDLKYYQEHQYFPYASLSQYLKENAAHFIDFGAEIIRRNVDLDDIFTTCTSHFNVKGYALLAEIAKEYMNTAAIIPASDQAEVSRSE